MTNPFRGSITEQITSLLTYGTEISKKKKTMKDRNTLEAK
jgi:hypothetical protein